MVNKRTRYGKDEHSFNGNHLIGISLAPIWAPNPKAVGSFSVLADNWHFKSAIGSLPQPGKLQTAQPSSVTGERKGSQVLVHLPSRSSTQTHKPKKKSSRPPPPPPSPLCTTTPPRNAIEPSTRAPSPRPPHAPPLDPERLAAIRSRCRPPAPPASPPPTLATLSLCHRHGPPPPAATRRRPSNHQTPPTRLHRWISASSQQHTSRPRSWRPSRSGGRSFGWTSPNLDATAQHSRARPDGPDPVCAGECLGESILTTSQPSPHTLSSQSILTI